MGEASFRFPSVAPYTLQLDAKNKILYHYFLAFLAISIVEW